MTSETIQQGIFLVLAALMLVSSVGVILARNQVYAAMSLVASFFFLAAIYAMLGAHTIAILQVLVYAGAIVVLFLFVIMLLSIQESPRIPFLQTLSVGRVAVFAAAIFLGVLMVAVSLNTSAPTIQVKIVSVESGMGGEHLVTFDSSPFGQMRYATGKLGSGQVLGRAEDAFSFDITGVTASEPPVQTLSLTGGRGEPKVGDIARVTAEAGALRPEFGTIAELGTLLYGRYLLPFEVTSLLLLVSIVGAVVVAKGKI